MAEQVDLTIIREPERLRLTSVSRVQWWRYMVAGTAPQKVRLGPNSVGWFRHEVEKWLLDRAAARKPPATKAPEAPVGAR